MYKVASDGDHVAVKAHSVAVVGSVMVSLRKVKSGTLDSIPPFLVSQHIH